MYIMGRENADGKATGVVHKIAEDGTHKLCGSFKIMSDGLITRFTGLSKADWNNFMNSAEAEYKNKYSETATTEPTAEKVAV
jgi:roadblock/LC7 domain-containing protein